MGGPDLRLRVEAAEDEEALSYDLIEQDIAAVRGRQRVRVAALEDVREQHVELRGALDRELSQLKKHALRLRDPQRGEGLWARLTQRLEALFGREGEARVSVEQLLRSQYDTSLVRLKQAAELATRLDRIQGELYDEIEDLNRRIVASARFEDEAAKRLLDLGAARDALAPRIAHSEGKAERRALEAERDALRRQMAELSTQMQLHTTREERLGRLKQSTELLAQTIANLASDMRRYVSAAGEKLDLVANQIQAVGVAADASGVLVDLKRSLDSMTTSMNDATQFVTEVQSFFHQHVDGLLRDLEVYDAETVARLEVSQEFSQLSDERRIEEGLELAAQRQEPGAR